MKKGKEAINIIWQLIAPVKFSDDEYIELTFDNQGDRQFIFAYHTQDKDDLIDFIQSQPTSNYAICVNTRKTKKVAKRTGQHAAYRQKLIVLDIEDPNNHTYLTPDQVKQLIKNVWQELPEEIKKSVIYTGYTGGGGHITIKLSRWVESGEISIVYEVLKNKLKNIKYIDKTSFNYGQPQRLLGTKNLKYGVDTFIYKVNEKCEPLNVDDLLNIWESQQRIESDIATKIEENKGKIKNLREAIDEIKKRVRIADLGYIVASGLDKTKTHCPFHPPDNHPSFVVYHNEDGDIAYDAHDMKSYDVISFYQEKEGKTFIEAVKELAEKAGVKLTFTKEAKEDFLKQTALTSFNPEVYIKEELKIQKIERYKEKGTYVYDFYLIDRDNTKVKLPMKHTELLNYRKALVIFAGYTGFIPAQLPKKAEREAWNMVLDTIFDLSVKDEMDFERSEYEWELEEVKQIIYNAATTTEIEDFERRNATFIKFYDPDRDKGYVNLQTLMTILKNVAAETMTRKKVITILRDIGAKPIRLYKKGYEIRCWELPEGDWRLKVNATDITDTTDTLTDTSKKSSVHSENIKNKGSSQFVDTTPSKNEKNLFLTEEKNEKIEKNSVHSVHKTGKTSNINNEILDTSLDSSVHKKRDSGHKGEIFIDDDDDIIYELDDLL